VCTVCLEPVDPSGGLLKLPCQHCFHARCIGDWAYWASRRRPGVPATCPSCRAGMEAKVIEELQKLLGVEDLLVLPLMVFSLLASCAPSARLLDPRPHASTHPRDAAGTASVASVAGRLDGGHDAAGHAARRPYMVGR